MASEVQDSGSGPRKGLFNSIRTLLATLLGIAHTRLELLSTELEEELVRYSSMLAWALVALFCAGLGVVFVTLVIVLALWDSHRLLAVGIPAILFTLGAITAALVVLGKAKAKPRLFSANLAELSKDREQLTSPP